MLILLLACTSEPAPQPNLLLVTLDTTRADHVGTDSTPNLRALARRGVSFSRVLSPAPITLPAHTSLMTGLDPQVHGVRNNARYTAGPELETLAETLTAHGYNTAAVVAARPLVADQGLDQGFQYYDDEGLMRPELGAHPPERRGDEVTEVALRTLEGLPEPWFLWVHYFDPHSPWVTKALPGETTYAAEVRFLDEVMGPLLDTVDAQDLVVVTSDHGEALGEHGEPTHGYFLHDATLHIPLILAGPGVPQGQTVGGTARLRDVHGMVLFLLGIADQAELAGWNEPHRPAYAETLMPAEALGLEPVFSWTEWPLRLIQSPTHRLYDLSADPQERLPVSGRDPEREALARHLAPTGEPSPEGPGDPALVALGYLDAPEIGSGEVYDNTELIRVALGLYSGTAIGTEELLRVLETYPTAPELQQRGLALLKGTEHYGPALERAEAALPEDDNIQARAALWWLQRGEEERANAALDRALASTARKSSSTAMAAFAALDLGRTEDARVLVAELEGRTLNGAGALYDRARLHHRLGELRDAVDDYRKVIELEPENAEAWRNMGYALAMAGRVEEAREALESSLELEDDPLARSRLAQLVATPEEP